MINELIVALVLMQASALLAVVGYIYNDAKKRDQRRKDDIKGVSQEVRKVDDRLTQLESNLFGHEKGSDGYITMTREEMDSLHTKLDSIKNQMDKEHEETKALLAEVVEWIEQADEKGKFNPDYDKTIDLEDDD